MPCICGADDCPRCHPGYVPDDVDLEAERDADEAYATIRAEQRAEARAFDLLDL